MKKILQTSAALSALFLVADAAQAQTQYFTTPVNNGTYSWDAANWSVNGGTSSGPFASTWVGGNFARFYGGSGDTYTVTVNTAESMAGMFLNSGASTTLNVNDAGNGTGSLSVVAGASQATQNGFSWLTQGFLTGGGTLNINAPITGTGGVEEESGGGNIELLGNNTFSGGFLATSSSTFTHFNNANSFGTGQIGFDGTTFAIMENDGPSTVNIANNMQTIGTTGVNFIGNGVTMSGNLYLGGGASAINLRNNGVGTTVKLNGVLSATTGTVTYSWANGGNISLGNQNTYTGKTIVGVTGDTTGTLTLAVPHALDTTTGLTLLGGTTLNVSGGNQFMNSASLTLSGSGVTTLDFGGAREIIELANSSGNTWTGTLNIVNYDPSLDTIIIGNNSSSLTGAQLADIEADGGSLGDAFVSPTGVLTVPEPSTVLLGLLGALGLGAARMFRRKTA